MKVNVLGTGNAFNLQGRMNSSYLVDTEQHRILVDCGFTVPLALQNEQIEFSSIDYVFITHYHGDHFAGLAALLLGLKYVYKQKKLLKIIGPGDVKSKVIGLMKALYFGSENLVDELKIEFISVPVQGGEFRSGEVIFDVHKMIHSEAALPVGYVLKVNRFNIGFSGDTSWHDGIIPFVNSCDKVILECNFSETVGKGHISVEELESSMEIQKRKEDLYLTHLYEGSARKANELGYQTLTDGDALIFEV
jgi:ribonuclease BN (tRNA processing enzyme)